MSFSGVTRVGDTRGSNWGCHPHFFIKKTDDLFCSSLSLLLILLGCHPLDGITPHLFHLSDLVCPLFFVDLPTKYFSFGCHPPRGCHPGGPPSDSTGHSATCATVMCIINAYLLTYLLKCHASRWIHKRWSLLWTCILTCPTEILTETTCDEESGSLDVG